MDYFPPMPAEWIVRNILQRYWRWQRPLTLGVRGMVLDEGARRVLLVKQTYAKGWLLPGGGVEKRETLLGSVRREIEEEAGVAVSGQARLLGIYSNEAIFRGDHVAVYIFREWHRVRDFEPGYEIAAADFFPIDHLPDDLTPGTRRRIEEMQGGRPVGDVW